MVLVCGETERKMEIRVTEQEILSGDISQVKAVIEKLALDSGLSAENENNIVVKFDNLRPLDLSRKLKDPSFRAWFRRLDGEIPYLPFFLSRQAATLMFFIMGNTEFSIDDQNTVNFDEMSKQHYISRKKSSIKAFCLSHNIDPRAALQRLNSFEPQSRKAAPQKIRIEEQLIQHGSVAYMTEQREYVISILIKKIPQDIKIKGTFYTERNCPQPFFTVFMEEDGVKNQYSVLPQISQRDTEEYLRQNPYARILIVFRNGDEFTAFPKITAKVSFATLEELEEQKKRFVEEEESLPQAEEEEKPQAEEEPAAPENQEEPEESAKESGVADESDDFDKTLPVADVEETPELPGRIEVGKKAEPEDEPYYDVPENETVHEKVIRLEKEVLRLRDKIASQKKIIEDLEEEINKKRSIGSFFKGLFK